MSRYRVYIFFSAVIVLGLLGVFLVAKGYYPIALIGNDFISAKRFAEEYAATSVYYGNVLKTYGEAVRGSPRLTPVELQLAVINGLVEKVLIARGARAEAGSDLNYLISNKIEKFSGDPELNKAASALYGLTPEEVEKDLLVPQAEREILAGRLYLRGEKLDDWLAKTKAAARVTVFSPRFKWNGERVVAE